MPTQDQVREAIAALEARGAHISPTTIRQQLGSGSFRDIVQHHKQIASEAPRRQATNGMRAQAAEGPPQPAPAPAPAPAPISKRAQLEHYLALARKRKADFEEKMEQLRVRGERLPAVGGVHEFNRTIIGTERAIAAAERDIVQYLSEISRLR